MKKINSLNMVKKIDPTYTNEYWQLYSSVLGYENAVTDLNAALKYAVNLEGSTAITVRQIMGPVMLSFQDFGALDTEPREFLYSILDHIYGDE